MSRWRLAWLNDTGQDPCRDAPPTSSNSPFTTRGRSDFASFFCGRTTGNLPHQGAMACLSSSALRFSGKNTEYPYSVEPSLWAGQGPSERKGNPTCLRKSSSYPGQRTISAGNENANYRNASTFWPCSSCRLVMSPGVKRKKKKKKTGTHTWARENYGHFH